jgi:hypothetical protein
MEIAADVEQQPLVKASIELQEKLVQEED